MRALALAALLALTLAASPALAQSHAHAGGGPRLLLLHDSDGRVLVDNLAFFGFALVDESGAPVEHSDHRFTLTQNGRVLLDTPDAHEYDGLFTASYRFLEEGAYEVRAQALDGDRVVAEASFAGEAVAPRGRTIANVTLDAPATLAAGVAAPLVVTVSGGGGLLPHVDALVEVRRAADALLVLRAHLHQHEEPMTFEYAFPTPGDYLVVVTAFNAFPEEGRPEFASSTLAVPLRVGVPQVPPLAAPAPTPLRAAADASAADAPYSLHLTTDPSPLAGERVIGPLTAMRLAALVHDDAAGAAVAHVDFRATLAGPAGVVFASESLHEYDGVHEVLVSGLAPGEYDFALEATHARTGWSDAGATRFRVAPPVVPFTAGVFEVRLAPGTSVVAGEPADLVLTALDALGGPYSHTELDVTAFPPGSGTPQANLKLHTHGSGEYRLTATFPFEGVWRLLVDPTPLEPRPSLAVGPAGPGQPILLDVLVQPPGGFLDGVAPEASASADDDASPIPAPGALAGLAALALVAAASRRRRAP